MYAVLLLVTCIITGGDGRHHNKGHGNQKIFGGEVTTIDEAPFVVSILVQTSDVNLKLLCGGAVIHPFMALTSASCVTKIEEEEIGDLYVRSNTERWNCDCHRARTHQVKGFIRHEDFDKEFWGVYVNDIGIITVFDEFLGVFANPIPYNMGSRYWQYASSSDKRKESYAVGWGDDDWRLFPRPVNQLKRINIDIYDKRKCLREHQSPGAANQLFYCGQWPVGATKGGPCEFDDGGPNAVKVEGQWILIGIISFPKGCDWLGSMTTTFTNVSKFSRWIDGNIKRDFDPKEWYL